jgi:hypothetical protein
MNRLTSLALKLFGLRTKRQVYPPCTKTWSGSIDDYNKLVVNNLLDSETFYAILGLPPKTVPMSKATIASMLNTVHMAKLPMLEAHDPSASIGTFKDGVFMPSAIDVTNIDGPTFLPADLFKDGGTGDLMVDGIQLSFKDGVVTRLEVNGTAYRVLSAEHNDLDFLASVYNPENTITVRDHLTEAVKRLKVYQP